MVVGDTLTINTGANLQTVDHHVGRHPGRRRHGRQRHRPRCRIAHANGSAVRNQSKPGTGITFDPALSAAHAIGTTTRGSGTGVTVSAPLTIAHAAGATAVAARQRYLGIYTPPGYDVNRPQPYKTIYLQHGSGQDASDWMNIGDAPVLMDNLIQDGLTEPAVIVTTDQNYLGGSPYTILESTIIPFVQNNYHVSTDRMDRRVRRPVGRRVDDREHHQQQPAALRLLRRLVWTPNINTNTANVKKAYIHIGFGRWDTTVAPPSRQPPSITCSFRTCTSSMSPSPAGHDFNAWNQLLTRFMRDYLWKPPETFVYTAPKTDQHINFGRSPTRPSATPISGSAPRRRRACRSASA